LRFDSRRGPLSGEKPAANLIPAATAPPEKRKDALAENPLRFYVRSLRPVFPVFRRLFFFRSDFRRAHSAQAPQKDLPLCSAFYSRAGFSILPKGTAPNFFFRLRLRPSVRQRP
jgi:hypothetical protein